jgi:hypothetical protein
LKYSVLTSSTRTALALVDSGAPILCFQLYDRLLGALHHGYENSCGFMTFPYQGNGSVTGSKCTLVQHQRNGRLRQIFHAGYGQTKLRGMRHRAYPRKRYVFLANTYIQTKCILSQKHTSSTKRVCFRQRVPIAKPNRLRLAEGYSQPHYLTRSKRETEGSYCQTPPSPALSRFWKTGGLFTTPPLLETRDGGFLLPIPAFHSKIE